MSASESDGGQAGLEHAVESRRLYCLAIPSEASPEYHELVMCEAQWHATMAVYEALRSLRALGS